ncbi:hypothetical protein STXM2123_3388 [Streptomyces sp. F-3]|nr:hypothetical protein STXM2123_3388 [Streptomyces sp. F-3]
MPFGRRAGTAVPGTAVPGTVVPGTVVPSFGPPFLRDLHG